MPTAAFDFPGIRRVLDFSYTASVGITPGVIAVTAAPSGADNGVTGEGPESVGPCAGTFRFSDGVLGMTVGDCRLAPNGFRQTHDGGGRLWHYTLQDRRWRWADAYAVDGDYNQLDDRKKLIPWTVRSPFQLACLLLDAMGELGYAVDLPGGLSAPTQAGVVGPGGPFDAAVNPAADYLQLGQNLPATNTNPHVVWAGVPAARALADLAAEYGRVVVYNPGSEQVSVQQMGLGSVPPPGAVLSVSPGIDPPRVPVAVIGRGAPTRNQLRLVFRPVARDWDDSWQALENVSYAPAQAGQRMRVLVLSGDITLNGVVFAGGFAGMAAAINGSADPRVAGKVTAAALAANAGLIVSGVADGYEFDIVFGAGVSGVCLAGPAAAGRGFAYCSPADFSTAVSTPNLTSTQARQLALASVWRHYQLVAADPADPAKPGIPLPGGGRLFNRFLAVLQETRPEQVVPRPGDENRTDPATGQPYAAETYNGYSKDRAPATFGGLAFDLAAGGQWALRTDLVLSNTPKRSQFYVPFRVVDAARQVVEFDRQIYRILGGATALATNAQFPAVALLAAGATCFVPPDLVIETGVLLLDPATLSPLRCVRVLALANSAAPPRTVMVPDAQADVVTLYDAAHKIVGATQVDLYAQNCLAATCAAVAATYQTGTSMSATYPRIVPVALSGLTRQVTYAMNRGGFTTTASVNSEHSTVVPSYPARRRAENLAQDAARGLQNLRSRTAPANAVKRAADGGM